MEDQTGNRSFLNRFFLSAFAAAAITFGLFAGMQSLVNVEFLELEKPDIRPLVRVTPSEPDVEVKRKERSKVELIEIPEFPAPRQIERVPSGDVEIGSAPIREVAPELPDVGPVFPTKPPVPTSGKAVPVRRPVPDYPERALRQNLEGSCQVGFSVDAAGRPFNVEASCSDRVFEASSKKAVRKALFAAKIEDGVAKGQDNLVYPIVYSMSND